MGFLIETTAHRRYFPLGKNFAGASDDMSVRYALGSYPINMYIDRQKVLEKRGGPIVAGAMDARPRVEIRTMRSW